MKTAALIPRLSLFESFIAATSRRGRIRGFFGLVCTSLLAKREKAPNTEKTQGGWTITGSF
jgi:hypothetical protein